MTKNKYKRDMKGKFSRLGKMKPYFAYLLIKGIFIFFLTIGAFELVTNFDFYVEFTKNYYALNSI